MATDMDKAMEISTAIARGAIGLTLLDELHEIAKVHEASQCEYHEILQNQSNALNDRTMGRMLTVIRRAAAALETIGKDDDDDDIDDDD